MAAVAPADQMAMLCELLMWRCRAVRGEAHWSLDARLQLKDVRYRSRLGDSARSDTRVCDLRTNAVGYLRPPVRLYGTEVHCLRSAHELVRGPSWKAASGLIDGRYLPPSPQSTDQHD